MTDRPVTHQTVRLRRGKHDGPEKGVCVMELASMLAGERFTDRPISVCPIIAGFLRAYNDAIDDQRRQDLYPIAAAVVGTATTDQTVIAERVHLIAEWGRAHAGRRRRRRFLLRLVPIGIYESVGREIGSYVVRAIGPIDDVAHASALRLVDLVLGDDEPVAPLEESLLVGAVVGD
jgi:hypothetical protein